MILLDLFSFTDLKKIQFAFIIIVFVNDTDYFSFSLMNIFKADVRINEILVRILSILTSALKMFINKNRKWSVSFTKTVIIDVNWTSLRSVNENRSKRITIKSLKMQKIDTAVKTVMSYWSIKFSECQTDLKSS